MTKFPNYRIVKNEIWAFNEINNYSELKKNFTIEKAIKKFPNITYDLFD